MGLKEEHIARLSQHRLEVTLCYFSPSLRFYWQHVLLFSSHGINKVLEVLNSMRLSVAVSMKRGQKPEYVENTKERQLCVVCYTFKTKHQKKLKYTMSEK